MTWGIQSVGRIRSRCVGTPCFPAARTGHALVVANRRCHSTVGSLPNSKPETKPELRLESESKSLALATPIESLPPAQVVGPNYVRNEFFRNVYREYDSPIGTEMEKKMSSPYTPTTRNYPSTKATWESKSEAKSMARLQVAYDAVWNSLGTRVESFSETFNLLKKMTVKQDEKSKMAAMKIVLPKEWDVDVGNRKVEYVDSATGLMAKLRLSGDHQNPSAIILRGKSSVLAKAADELVRACPAVEVYKLGEVAAYGYEVKRLWPVIEGAPDGGSSIPEDKADNIWVHREHRGFWIEEAYEKATRPEQWTAESFEAYIAKLVFGRLRPHLGARVYSERVDTDGVRIGLVMRAFEDPRARAHITPGGLKMAMALMARKGGHRAQADRLLKLAEEWGMPMDTDLFNIMLEGYAAKHDVAFFHKFLLKMQARFFRPDVRTWLLFLELVQREVERRQVMVAMYDLGFFADPATRRGMARVMASHDAYVAFKAGKKMDVFLAEQRARYGADWFTTGSLNAILDEFLRFHTPHHRRFNDFKRLIERQSEDGQKIDISTINLVLRHCLPFSNWAAALWALSKLSSPSSSSGEEYECEPNAETYDALLSLAISSRSPGALGVTFFYAAIDRMLRLPARTRMHDMLTRRTGDASTRDFWRRHPPRIFSRAMGAGLQRTQRVRKENVVAGVERAILLECDGWAPVKTLAHSVGVALRTMDAPLHHQEKRGVEARVGCLAVKLRGKGGGKVVHLDGWFVPETMIKWSRHHKY